ncbi:transposase, partial [Methanosarcina sp. KYL-1]|uniref:RNA-guided endonuclease TnpB family protein n=1 Tax=Methanosarcina sp. KYL-1 TaxID=2602068 RepID=UPI0021014F96
MLKAYKFRLYPAAEQKIMIEKHIGSCRFIYNWALEQKIKSYEQEGKSLSCYDLNNLLPELKKEHEWLKEVNSQSLQGMTKNLDSAFTEFFREKNGFPNFKSRKNPIQSFREKNGFPNFKSRKNPIQSFPVPQHYTVDFENNVVKLPKIGKVKAVLHQRFEGKLKTATVSRTS